MARALTKAGRYQIVSELGRGSMGVVYQGFDPVIGRTVAIKTMLTEGLPPQEFEEFKARFQREAQAAGVLTHPNIVTVYDFGEDSGVLYLAMEYLEGKSLEKIVEEQNVLPIETITPIFEQVCSALGQAHAHKIVHRDIKPANIMILDSGLVKVTDFGIAKMMAAGMTQAGQILGTPNYMSPEQVRGRPVDGRSDIFSLGVILYELVTGEKPFGGQNITTVIYKIINENPIPPRELDSTIHPGLSYVISKALAKSPDERYQTCAELTEDLKNYRNLGGQPAASATVVLRVPPMQVAQPEPAPAAAPPSPPPVAAPARAISVQVIPPGKSQLQGTSAVTWLLLLLLLGGVLGGGAYYFLLHGRGQTRTAESTLPAATESASQPAPAASAPTETPGTTTPTDVQQPTPTPEAPASAESQPQTEVPAPKVEPPKQEEKPRPSPPIAAPSSPRRAALTPKIGELQVAANFPGASISLDGRSDPAWVTPYTFRDLPPGTHLLVVSKEGYDDVRQSVTIEAGGANTFTAQLSVPSGEINILTVPPGVEVVIDGQSYGPSPVRATVMAGDHKYVIRRSGRTAYESAFKMKSGDIITKRIDLGGEVAPNGVLEVHTAPPGATILADGAPAGGQTPTSIRLTAGRHTLVISLSGFRTVEQQVDVTADGTAQINITLPPE